MQQYEVSVIGAGASGIFCVNHLLRSNLGWKALWIGVDDGPGVAYSSRFDSHLLNVPAGRMGAFADAPGHFHEWLLTHPEYGDFAPTDFVPRRLYGEYLCTLRKAALRSPLLDMSSSPVVAIDSVEEGGLLGWRLRLQDGSHAFSRRLILATGLPTPDITDRHGLMIPGLIVKDPWRWLSSLRESGAASLPTEVIEICGSGLTAMDVVVALRDLGFAGQIRALSRSGRWSASHEPTEALPESTRLTLIAEMLASPTCRGYTRIVRRLVAEWPWRAVLDGLRPASQQLWEALPLAERKRFLRHVFSLWNRHRHRAPPATVRRIAKDTRLTLSRGKYIERSSREALLVDCRGMGLTSARVWPAFINDLRSSGLLTESALGIGLTSRDPTRLAVLGALRFGAEFECTAVPELRQQAAGIIEQWQREATLDR